MPIGILWREKNHGISITIWKFELWRVCAIDGGNKAQDVGYQVGKYIGITATLILKLMGY